jgi:hypothetical protein
MLEIINLKRGMVYFGSGIQRFQSMVCGPIAFLGLYIVVRSAWQNKQLTSWLGSERR